MGPFIFLLLSTCQCSWVCNSFLALSRALWGSSGLPDCAINLFLALGIFCQTIAFIFSLDDCHKSMKVLSKSLMTDMIEMEPGRSRREAKSVLKVQLLDISQSVKMWLFRSWRLQGPWQDLACSRWRGALSRACCPWPSPTSSYLYSSRWL